jgi:hypothetical protein
LDKLIFRKHTKVVFQLDFEIIFVNRFLSSVCLWHLKFILQSKYEAYLFEIDLTVDEITNHLNHLDDWIKPEPVQKDLLNKMFDCFIKREPFGVCLIIGAWNYPVQLTMLPLIGALSAGKPLYSSRVFFLTTQ